MGVSKKRSVSLVLVPKCLVYKRDRKKKIKSNIGVRLFSAHLLFRLFTFMKLTRRREDTELQELPFSADQLTQWFIWLLLKLKFTRYTEKSRVISIFPTSWLLCPFICLSNELASNVTLENSEESTVFWSFLRGFSCVTLSRLSTGGVRSACCSLKTLSHSLSDLQKFLTGYVTAKGYSLSRLRVYLISLEELKWHPP